MSARFAHLFQAPGPSVIAMVHTGASPGSPAYTGDVATIIRQAVNEAQLFDKVGVDALLIENMHDTPYLKRQVGPEVSSLMAIIASRIKQETSLPCGIQILAGANQAALAVALAAGLDFIRAEGFVYGHLADEGYIDADAAGLLRYRRQIGAEHIAVLTDIKKKHSSHALTADVSLADTARTAAFCRSDGLILTGNATGEAASTKDMEEVRLAVDLPLLIGSGITYNNMEAYLSADAWIIGSHFKKDGHWSQAVDVKRVEAFMQKKNNMG